MRYEQVIDGVHRFIDREIMANMNDWQEVLARIAISRTLGRSDLKEILMTNPFVKTFAIIDSEGDVDIDGLMNDLRHQIRAKGKIEISMPLFGKFTFRENDVDTLYRTIMEG